MKKIILSLTILTTIISCKKNPENQVKENVKKFMLLKINDPQSYESVSFGKLDSLHSSFIDSKEGIKIKQEFDSLSKRMNELADESLNPNPNLSELKFEQELSAVSKRQKQISDLLFIKTIKYKGAFTGFKTKHLFREKNKMGAIILDSCTVILDKNLNVKTIK